MLCVERRFAACSLAARETPHNSQLPLAQQTVCCALVPKDLRCQTLAHPRRYPPTPRPRVKLESAIQTQLAGPNEATGKLVRANPGVKHVVVFMLVSAPVELDNARCMCAECRSGSTMANSSRYWNPVCFLTPMDGWLAPAPAAAGPSAATIGPPSDSEYASTALPSAATAVAGARLLLRPGWSGIHQPLCSLTSRCACAISAAQSSRCPSSQSNF